MFRTLKTVEPQTASEEAAYSKWLDQTADRQQARQDRVHGAVGVIPTPLWIVLFTISVVIFAYMLFFADKGEGAVTQAMLMGSVVFVIVDAAVAAPVPRQSVPARDRVVASGRDGANAAHPRRRTRNRRIRHAAAVRRVRTVDRGRDRGQWLRNDQRAAPKQRDVIEIFATVLLALAAVATAWSSYQANRWNGEQVKAGSRTNALADRRRPRAGPVRSRDAGRRGDVHPVGRCVRDRGTSSCRTSTEARFRPEFKPAFDAWIATEPFQNADAPLTPFRMPEYQPAAKAEAARLDAAAAASAERVQRNLQRSANYVLAVVLFAVALFFAGISTKLETRRLRILLLTAGWCVLLGTVVWLATFPVSISV